MGTIKQGILGGFSGKVGTVIGVVWKGICTMRGIAPSVSQPNSPAQLEQRARFKAVIDFLHPLTAFLRVGFKNQAIKMSQFNAAMSYNLENALTGAYPVFDIDYSKALVSRGNLTGALNPVAAAVAGVGIDFTWDDNSMSAGALPDDKVLLVVYNPAKQLAITVEAGNTRVSGTQTINLPSFFEGDEVQCYIGFQNANQSVVSNSQYVSSLVVL
ncbi:MAG TPA: DUF6266 family protein [Prolixibacteraceae bacterium]|jgi:hypothetical protein